MRGIRPRRSVLYMPGANARALQKARSLPADCLIFDLEDGVAPEAKEDARAQVAEALSQGGYGSREIAIRVNGLSTPWGKDDLAMAANSGADAVLFSKPDTAGDIAAMREAIRQAGARAGLALWVMMETPLAILNAREIAAAAADADHPLSLFVMGTNDLAKLTRASAGGDRRGLTAWLSICVAAARAYGVDIIDGIYTDFRDEAGFKRECEQARELGFNGKSLIHPSQIAQANRSFGPTESEVAWARKVLDAFAAPGAEAEGVLDIDGRMVERVDTAVARRTVSLAESIEEAGA